MFFKRKSREAPLSWAEISESPDVLKHYFVGIVVISGIANDAMDISKEKIETTTGIHHL